AALEPGDQAAFVARVVAAAARPARTLDVLATWARRGLAAAMAAAAIAGFLVGRGGQAATIPEDTLAPTSAGAASIAFVTAARPPRTPWRARRHGQLPGRPSSPLGRPEGFGAGGPRAAPARNGSVVAGGASALRLDPDADPQRDQRAVDGGAT